MLPVRRTVAYALSPGGCFFAMRAIVLFDGQNLFRAAKDAWGPNPPDPSSSYDWPSYDVELLAQHLVALAPSRQLVEIRFYTGVYSSAVDAPRHTFWTNKLDYLETQGVHVYRGRVNSSGQEKGVDVSLALDLVQATYEQRYETAIIVIQDADFGPAVFLARNIVRVQGRQLLFESAFPVGPGTLRGRRRGVPGTRWVHIGQTGYDACRDPRDYRPPRR